MIKLSYNLFNPWGLLKLELADNTTILSGRSQLVCLIGRNPFIPGIFLDIALISVLLFAAIATKIPFISVTSILRYYSIAIGAFPVPTAIGCHSFFSRISCFAWAAIRSIPLRIWLFSVVVTQVSWVWSQFFHLTFSGISYHL